MKRILAISDLHCGSLSGLTPPGWWSNRTVPTQKPLWEWFAHTVEKIGKVDALVLNGDAVDGEGKGDSIWALTTDTEEQAEIALQAVQIIRAKSIYLTYGTPYHTAGSYSYENLVAKRLGASIQDTQYLESDGVKFSFRHVTGNSGTPYTAGTQALKEAVRDLVTALQEEAPPADVVCRGHVHNFLHIETKSRRAVTLPCLEVPNSVYGRKCRTWNYDIGVVLFEVREGRVHVVPYLMPLKIVVRREYTKV